MMEYDITIGEFGLVQTCFACPEQYDVFLDGEEVAYLRLRHGHFSAEAPFGGKIVYESTPNGDGIFDSEERDGELRNAVDAIRASLAPSPATP